MIKMTPLLEYVILEKLKDDFEVRPTNKQDVAQFIQKHYLKKFPTGIKKIYGVYQKNQAVGPSTTEGNKMVGMIIYGAPFFTASKFLEKYVKPDEVLELKRLFIDDIGVRNIESFVIGQSLNLIKKEMPNIKMVITFADEKAGHVGSIYQATNAIYLGQGADGKHKYIYLLGKDAEQLKALIEPKDYPKKPEPPADTQLQKAISEGDKPAVVKPFFFNFGMIVKDPGRKQNKWIKTSICEAKGQPRSPDENTMVKLFMVPFQLYAQNHLQETNLNKLFTSQDVRIARVALTPGQYVRMLIAIPDKYWRPDSIEEIKDNPLRLARDHSNQIEAAFKNKVLVEIDYDLRIPGAVTIAWKGHGNA